MSRSSDTHSAGSLQVLVRGCWQMLWCRLDGPLLLMYGGPRGSGALQHSIDLRGCTLRAHTCSLSIARQDRELALLQAVSLEERGRWLRLLSAAGGADADPDPDPDHAYEDPSLATGAWNGAGNGPVSGLLQRRVTTPNAYMDDPFGQVSIQPTPGDGDRDRDSDRDGDGSPSPPQQRLALPNQQLGDRKGTRFAENYQRNTNSSQGARYNTLPSARFLTYWGELERKAPEGERAAARDQSTQTDKKDFKEAMDPLPERKALPRLEEKMRRLEQAVLRAKERVKSGSELNLLSLSKTFKRASCGHSLALFSSSSETADPEVAIVSPILRRTASAKCSLRRAPSVLGVERGRVLQKTKEWEMKSSV
ncbi:actin filament-associated protein 1-like 1 [Amblyraja radiata]|uniref:actin filament-associated protein 1-like 1 n=1 Tax=Amblyraja radiata TaxID=386614 RepID=UPI0014035D11|nr:actin filament-associated protein 1-like 1 [Amblyraja radiata]